jgi:signal transduction histidine kinase
MTGPAFPGDRAGWSLQRRVTALCLLAAAVLALLAAGATTTAAANRSEIDILIDRIGPMRLAATDLNGALVDQQTGIRGFVLRGDDADLAPYDQGLRDEEAATAAIASNPAATEEIRSELGVITARAAAWRTTFVEPAITAMRAGDQATAQSLLTDAGSDAFEQIRAAVDDMQATMLAITNASATNVKDTSSTLLFVLIVAAVLVIAAGVSLIVALQRTVIGPVTELAARVRTVALGNYDHRISADGPPELEHLAVDVDVMRRRIVADLAEVERSRLQIEEANRLLEQQAAELTRSNRDLEQFAYVASHDLQEPLRKVASFCQLLQRRYQGQLDERADQYIAFAVNGAQRMQRLINDLLAFSRIGRSTTGFADVNLGRLVDEAIATLDATLEKAGAEVTWTDLPTVRGEEPLLTTLLTNLIGNSIKFRRPDVPARVHLSGRRVEEAWEITCADNGIGIDPEYAEKVFVIFQRLHSREAYAGTGIGLAMAKKIVEYHGGQIWVDTDSQEGTTIRFTLPVATAPVAAGEPAGDDGALVMPLHVKEPVA